ncbi:uncharacterized protein [Dysidea avara]
MMTDDDNTGWSAARNVFGEIRHLLCRWHVDRAWKNKIRSVASQHQKELYQTLCILSSELDLPTFETRMAQFIKVWTPLEPDFVKYFSDHYQSRAEKWATCHQHFKHGDTDTNMYLESFHNQLKTNYLNGKVNRRVDFLIHHLLEYEKDQFFRYKRDHLLPPPMHKRIQQEISHHQRGMKIPATKVKGTILSRSTRITHPVRSWGVRTVTGEIRAA